MKADHHGLPGVVTEVARPALDAQQPGARRGTNHVVHGQSGERHGPLDLKRAGAYSTPKPARWMSTSETSGLAGGIGTITALMPSVPVAAGCTA